MAKWRLSYATFLGYSTEADRKTSCIPQLREQSINFLASPDPSFKKILEYVIVRV
jgi:hypothetical protein